MDYSKQVIFCLVPGGTHASQANKDAYTNAQRLQNKRRLAEEAPKSKLETLYDTGTPNLTKFQKYIDDNTRVYLVGHGGSESNSLAHLDLDELTKMIKTLVPPNKKIKRLGLVSCFSGLSEEGLAGPPHSLAVSLFKKISDHVVELTGYSGAVTTAIEMYAQPVQGSIPARDDGKDVHIVKGTGKKIVDQGNRKGRKLIVTAEGRWWAQDD
jgi:hypothetical protein